MEPLTELQQTLVCAASCYFKRCKVLQTYFFCFLTLVLDLGSGSNFKATNQHYTSPANPSIMTTSAVYQPVSRPMAASATLQSTPRSSPASLCVQPVSKGMINPIVPQAVVRPSPVQPVSRSLLIPVTTQPVSRPVSIPATAQQMQQTFTAVTAQSIIINNQVVYTSVPLNYKADTLSKKPLHCSNYTKKAWC